MADITEIHELAQKLNLWNIARGYIDLNDEKLSNLDYLKMVLEKELEIYSAPRCQDTEKIL